MFPAHTAGLLFVMMEWTPNRIITLFLGLWVALAPAVFAVPAAAMTLQMSISDDAGSGCCDGCPDADADCNVCALMCLNLVPFATIAEHGKLGTAVLHDDHWPGRDLALLGRVSTPEPAPPKPISLL